MVLGVPRAYLDLSRRTKARTLEPGAQKLGLKEGYVDLVLSNHPAITPEITQAVNTARAKLKSN